MAIDWNRYEKTAKVSDAKAKKQTAEYNKYLKKQKALEAKAEKDKKLKETTTRAKDKKKVVVNNHKNGKNMTAEAKKYQKEYLGKTKLAKDMFDQEEDYTQKFKKGNVLGGTANLIGAGLTGAQSIYLNALNNADSLVHGDGLQDFKYNMSNDDYQRAVVDRRGGGDTINEMADKKSPILGSFVRTVGEIATDPLELTPAGTYNDIKTARQGVKSVGYAKDLQKGKLVGEGTYKPTVEVNKPRVTKTPQAKAKDFRANVVEKGNEATKNISNEKSSVMSLKPTVKPKNVTDGISKSADTAKVETIENQDRILEINKQIASVKRKLKKLDKNLSEGKIPISIHELDKLDLYREEAILEREAKNIKNGVTSDVEIKRKGKGWEELTPDEKYARHWRIQQAISGISPMARDSMEKEIKALGEVTPKTKDAVINRWIDRYGKTEYYNSKPLPDNVVRERYEKAFDEWEDFARAYIKDENEFNLWENAGRGISEKAYYTDLPRDFPNTNVTDEIAESTNTTKGTGKTVKSAKTDLKPNGTDVTTTKADDVVVDNSIQDSGVVSPDVKFVDDTIQNGKGLFKKLYQNFVSGQSELERMSKTQGAKNVDSYTQAVRNAKGTVASIFDKGIVDTTGKMVNNTAYKDLINQIPSKDLADFNTFSQHLHNIDRWKYDVPVFKQVSADESRQIVEDMLKLHPEFAKYSDDITKWWNEFTKTWLLDTGRMTKDAYDTMLAKYPHYMPTYRVEKSRGISGTLGNKANAGTATRAAVGGTSDVIPLEDGFLSEIDRIVSTTKKNDLYADIVMSIKNNPDELRRYGVYTGDAPNYKITDIDQMLDDVEQTSLKEVSDKVAMVTAYIDGKPVSAYVNKDVLKALKLLDDAMGSKEARFFANIGNAITNPVKAGITGYNPLFALSNAMRDIPTLFIQSKHNPFVTISSLGKAIKEMATKGDLYSQYIGLGAKTSGYYNQGKGFAQALGKDRNAFQKSVYGLQRIFSALGEGAETVPRLAEFISGVNKYGNTKEGVLRALKDAGEVTVNFSRSAPITKTLDGWTLYLNAAVQGLDKFARTVKAHPLKTTARGLGIVTAPYMALMMVNWDNPHYQDLNERTKQNYYCIPNIMGEKDMQGNATTFIKVPINREYGAVLGSILDVIAGYVVGEENPFEGYGETIATNFAPPSPLADNILSPIVTNLPNNKDFAGRKIVPTAMENASPRNQYDVTTSGFAKGVSNLANYLADKGDIADALIPDMLQSPKKVDYLTDSYGGYFGSVLQGATSGNPQDASSYINDALLRNTIADPFAQRFTADPRYSSGAVEDFYNEMDKLNQEKTDDKLDGAKTDSNTTLATAKYKVYNKIAIQLSDMTKKEKAILGKDALSQSEKEAQIKELRQKKNELAKSAKALAAKVEKDFKQSPEFVALDSNIQEKYKEGSGISKAKFAKIYNAQKGFDGSVSKSIEAIKKGASYKDLTNINSRISKRAYDNAKLLVKAGISSNEFERIANNADTNNNSHYTVDELTTYLNKQNWSRETKAKVFKALSTAKNNPYA